MNRAIITLLVAALAALAAPVNASGCVPTTSNPELDTGQTPEGRYYFDDDCTAIVLCQLVLMSFWVYEESNGIDGLQRQDGVHDDTCGGQIPGDKIIL